MDPSRTLGTLNPAECEKLLVQSSQLEKAWHSAPASTEGVKLEDFLPPATDPLRLAALHELIPVDLEARCRRGQKVSLGTYLRRFPELGSREALPARLVYAEYRIRQLCGDKPELASYEEHFPNQFAELQKLLLEQPVPTKLPPPPQRPAPLVRPAASPMMPSPQNPLSMSGDYRLINRIGAGNFGEVWRAEAPGGVEVAIKIIRRPLDHEEAQRELHALELIKGLRHPFLLQTQAFWSLEDRLLIVMDLADGSLRNLLKEGEESGTPVPLGELLGYLREAAEALDFLHARNVQHRDVKPDNILLLGKHIKVADFGLAKLQADRSQVTATGSGTPAYMPPEIWSGKVSHHSDQYSLAITYAELRMNRRMFASVNLAQIMLDHMQGTPDLAGLGVKETAVVLTALSKVPEDRHPSCLAFVKALEQAIQEDTAPPLPPPAPPERAPATSRRWLAAAAIFISLAAVLVILSRPYWERWHIIPEPNKDEVDWLPKGYEHDPGTAIKVVDGQRFYEAVVKEVGGQPVRFVLIPHGRENDPPTFYMMENKVWNALFEAVVNDGDCKNKLAELSVKFPFAVKNEWRRGARVDKKDFGIANGQLPVFRVTALEAYCMANCLGGQLPTTRQWYKAAGRRDGAAGPFQAPWKKGEISVDREAEGPMEVGTARNDRSLFGCRDMTGNGMEWTRDLNFPSDEALPVPNPTPDMTVQVVGRNFADPRPLLFELPLEESRNLPEALPYISFRVVLER